jgi:hypothetical protein
MHYKALLCERWRTGTIMHYNVKVMVSPFALEVLKFSMTVTPEHHNR